MSSIPRDTSRDDVLKNLLIDQIQTIADENGIETYDAFPEWICSNILGYDDEDSQEACKIGGPGDGDIDFFRWANVDGSISRERDYVQWGQAKFSVNCDREFTEADLDAFVATIDKLENATSATSSNVVFQEKAAEPSLK